ncbi:MAG: chemotaxis protein CheW [Desulfobacterales bacterium]
MKHINDRDERIYSGSEYLTFRLDKEIFALEAAGILEVIRYRPPTEVPRMPPWLPGIINLRGSLISVMDPVIIFGMNAPVRKAWFVICEIGNSKDCLPVAMPVTSVEDVIRVHPDQMVPPPEIGIMVNTDFIRGAIKHGDELLLLPDMDRLIRHAEEETARLTAGQETMAP